MKYTRLTIKCNYDFIKEITDLMSDYDGYVRDFFEEVKKSAFSALQVAEKRNEPNCNISAEVTITCPLVIRTIATELLAGIPKDCTDIYYMFEQIAAIPIDQFII